jgi:myo-inositol-1-phosphate synthase
MDKTKKLSELEQLQARRRKQEEQEKNQKLDIIIKLGIDFIEKYSTSVRDEILAKRSAAKKSDQYTYAEINLMVESAKTQLPTSPTLPLFPKYKWEKAQQEYNQLKGLMADYERIE